MGPYPRSPHGNQYLIMITEHFSKWVELIPFRKLVSGRIWERLLETFSRFGFPEQLITDKASYFTSKDFVDSCRVLCIRHKETTPYHPQSNITERVNRDLKRLVVTIPDTRKDWDAYLPEVGFAARTTVNSSTGFTPAYLNFGMELTLPLENELREHVGADTPSTSRYATELRHRICDTVREARESLDAAR